MRTDSLYLRTVASSVATSRPSALASSPMEPAVTGGNTVGMNFPTGFASMIAKAICPGCCAISDPQMA
jgi:hypothetical protein